MIWSFVLRVGIVEFYPRKESVGFERPNVGLLRVSKLIKKEAQNYLFANTLAFRTTEALATFLDFESLEICRKSPSMGVRIFLKSDDIPWDWYTERAARVSSAMIDADIHHIGQGPAPTMYQHSHYIKKVQLREVWEGKLRYVMRTLGPSKLQIDVRESSCPDTCCNVVALAIDAVREVFQHYPDKTFELVLCEKGPQSPTSPDFLVGLTKFTGLIPAGLTGLPTRARDVNRYLPRLSEAVEEELSFNGRHQH